MHNVALIPSYEPTHSLVDLAFELEEAGFELVVVDDGSGPGYRAVFESLPLGATLLALTLGCCFCGVLEIYGTTSPYVPFYWVAAGALAASALLALIIRK